MFVGEVIVDEKLDVSALNDDVFEDYCSFCLKKILISKVSCSACNLNIYCSIKCKVKHKK